MLPHQLYNYNGNVCRILVLMSQHFDRAYGLVMTFHVVRKWWNCQKYTWLLVIRKTWRI